MGAEAGDLWVFGYGSLMWRPDFPFAEAHLARLSGWHRSFCIVSRYYRGTDERPGLVLGLDRGGVCEGRVFRVRSEEASHVLQYLRRREQISGVYREAHLPVTLMGPARARRIAVMFLAEPAHPSFVRGLSLRQQAAIVSGAHGRSGSNLAYLVSTLEELRAFGIREAELERIVATIGPVRARSANNMAKPVHQGRSLKRWPRRPVVRLAAVKRFTHRLRLNSLN